MRFAISNLCFLTSSIPLEFDTDGTVTRLNPADPEHAAPDQILVLTWLQVGTLKLKSVPTISLFDSVNLPDAFPMPEIYDGTQHLHGKNILIMMLNGWGDMILIEPALRAFYQKGAAAGIPPLITIASNWMQNFPYPHVPYIHHVCPNIMTLKEFCNFDIIINLIPANYQKSAQLSLRDMYLQIMGIEDKYGGRDTPVLQPNPQRVGRIKPILDGIRKRTGKKLLCVNWRSRFPHKNAPANLFCGIVDAVSADYEAVIFKDEKDSQGMQKEIDAAKAPIMNLSYLIRDYHDTTAALSLIEALISVDTGIVHAAGAMGIPTVALFGPFPPKTHVSDYSSVIAVQASYRGQNCHAPCLETHRGCVEVDYSPQRVSPCFQTIEVNQALKAFANIMDWCHGTGKLPLKRSMACAS